MCECEVESSNPLQQKTKVSEIKLYKRRWIIITIFIFYAAINAAQWIEYAIISNVIVKYYGVSSYLVEWTSIVFMACYAPLVIPASYIVNKMVRISIRFRWCCIIYIQFCSAGLKSCLIIRRSRYNNRNGN